MEGGHVALVVDDDQDTCHAVKDPFEMAMPVMVHTASSLAQANQKLGQLPVDLVIVDHIIPGGDTIQFVQGLQAGEAHQVFVYTAVLRVAVGVDVRVVNKGFG